MIIENPAIFVVGPTGTGKSNLALELAAKHGGIIVNFDSIQFYKGLEIGSAAPTEDEKKTVEHVLYSYVEAPGEMTAGQFLRDLKQAAEKFPAGKPLFFVGGTGFYQQALEKGMYDVPEIEERLKNQIVDEFKAGNSARLFQELQDFDADHGLHHNDHYRIGRALELKRAFGLKTSDIKNLQSKKIVELKNVLKLGVDIDKQILQERIRLRTAQMIERGIVDETLKLVKKGMEDWAPLNSVGYKETKDYLRGILAKAELENEIVLSTTKLIKKQRTWFKRDSSILWSTEADLQGEVTQFLL